MGFISKSITAIQALSTCSDWGQVNNGEDKKSFAAHTITRISWNIPIVTIVSLSPLSLSLSLSLSISLSLSLSLALSLSRSLSLSLSLSLRYQHIIVNSAKVEAYTRHQ